MDSSKPSTELLLGRLTVPASRVDNLSFCATSVAGIDGFLASLPAANTPEMLNRLYRALPEVAALQGDRELRLAMLLRLQPAIFLHVDRLTERLTVTDKTARQLSLALALLKNLALGYKSVVADLLSDSTPNPQQLAGAIQLAITALARMLTTSWQCFVNPPANLWREIHALFLIARAHRIEELTPFSVQSVDNPSLAPRTVYLRILLVAAADPARISPRDLKMLLNFLDSYAQHANLLYGGENALFTIDPDRDRGPVLSVRMRVASPAFIGLDSARLVTHIDRYLAPSEIDLPPRLLAQLHRYWSSEILRRDEHREERQQVSAVFGLSRLHRLLTQTANIDDFLTRCQVQALRAGHHLLSIEDTTPRRTWQDTRENEAPAGSAWLQSSRSNPDDPITYTPQHNQKADEAVSVHAATQVNRSERGACIELGTAPDNLSPGELVATRSSDTERWRVGLVRWTRTTAAFSRLVGIEFLDLALIPCAAALIRNDQRSSAFFPAFLARPGDGEENLIVPSLPFIPGCQVMLIDGKESSGARLTEALDATPQLTQFHIEREKLNVN